jgi:hypothetical protein
MLNAMAELQELIPEHLRLKNAKSSKAGRVTFINAGRNNDISDDAIAISTGHKNISSLKSYIM